MVDEGPSNLFNAGREFRRNVPVRQFSTVSTAAHVREGIGPTKLLHVSRPVLAEDLRRVDLASQPVVEQALLDFASRPA